ncbi:MAG: serine hydrolase [Hyphomonadaceae bacterium]
MHRRSLILSGLAAGALAAPARAQPADSARRFSAARAYHLAHAGQALVILRSGVAYAEEYAPGLNLASALPIGAATSSFLPGLAAALVSDRVITLNEPAALTLSEWALDPVKSQITLRMLLDLTCGIAGGRAMSTLEACALTPVDQPGARFILDAAPTQIFMEVVRRKFAASGRDTNIALYLTQRILGPVGCAPANFARTPEGDVSLTDGAYVSAHAWARWGELMRRVGVWRATALIDGETLRDSCRGSWVQPRYGFGVWLAWPARETPTLQESDLWRGQPPLDLIMAASTNGDRLYVLPTQRIVVARQARERADWSDAAFIAALLADV